ncbi:MAG TPA: 5-dehydro-4-deoxy-D-glucuronate isomerase [Candidatus Limiplasma sp.]|nr:5-dehydro-4-deoxy-D-glucuronate isomerase [Candidatus Limiplasma sp.]HPS80403.1 5-dehydro-4-deoxy-D-glucuronate isomerase [Candidatus Limiplasma sp.]
MDIRYGANPKDFAHYTTEEIRSEFLIETLFMPDGVTVTYSHIDRMMVLGAMPKSKPLTLEGDVDVAGCLKAPYFLERREMGVFNLGGQGVLTADGQTFAMARLDCAYIGMGTKSVRFESENPEDPARFYLVSAPAHRACPTRQIRLSDAASRKLGSAESANVRTIYQFIHPQVLETCQLTMGLTMLEPGSVWNTMPCHTHERRMEIYLYLNVPENGAVFHLMGRPAETRHIVVTDQQAVISPSWSIHSACATGRYAFIWAMAGENQTFDDMDAIDTPTLR